MRQLKTGRSKRTKGLELDQAIKAWRLTETPAETLSDEPREAIFNEFRKLHASGEVPAPHATLFLPVARWAWGAAVPVFALSLLVGSVLLSQGSFDRGDLVVHHPRVEVTKSGDDVVFVIQNGDRTHKISKSTDPEAPVNGETTFTTTTGRFKDRLDSDAEIVFYRID